MNGAERAPEQDESAATAGDPHDAMAPLMLSMAEAVRRTARATLEAGELPTASHSGAGFPLAAASPDMLANAGVAALRDALASGNHRSSAFDLLTADALITAACEAAATGELPAPLSARHFLELLEAS